MKNLAIDRMKKGLRQSFLLRKEQTLPNQPLFTSSVNNEQHNANGDHDQDHHGHKRRKKGDSRYDIGNRLRDHHQEREKHLKGIDDKSNYSAD